MQISLQAAGVSRTVCVLHLPPTHRIFTRRCPPPNRLSKRLCVHLEPQNLNSKLVCESRPTLPPPPTSGPPRDYSTESLERKLLGTLSRLNPLKGLPSPPPQPYTPYLGREYRTAHPTLDPRRLQDPTHSEACSD